MQNDFARSPVALHPYRRGEDLSHLVVKDRRALKMFAVSMISIMLGAAGALVAPEVVAMASEDPFGTADWREVLVVAPDSTMIESAAEPEPTPRRGSTTDQARDALLTNPKSAKWLLMPIVASGRGSAEDVRILRAACEGLRDQACLDFLHGR